MFGPMGKSKVVLKMPEVSAEEAARRLKIANVAAKRFEGNFDELEGALGMFLIGYLMGWRVLVLIHNKRTIRKYEEILSINIREEFPETGPFTEKSLAYEIVQKAKTFWKAVSGEVPVDNRRMLQK